MQIIFILILSAIVTSGCQMTNLDSHPVSQDFKFAEDRTNSVTERVEAASRLDALEAQRLRILLLARVPGAYDSKAGDDLAVLAVVGDDATAASLDEKILDLKLPGQLRTAMKATAKEIRLHRPLTPEDFWNL